MILGWEPSPARQQLNQPSMKVNSLGKNSNNSSNPNNPTNGTIGLLLVSWAPDSNRAPTHTRILQTTHSQTIIPEQVFLWISLLGTALVDFDHISQTVLTFYFLSRTIEILEHSGYKQTLEAPSGIPSSAPQSGPTSILPQAISSCPTGPLLLLLWDTSVSS